MKGTQAARVQVCARASLPETRLSWLHLYDHFVATVGPRAGSGAPMGGLLVLADATFAPRSRFPLHPHKEMEILSVVLSGRLSHHGSQAHDTALQAREIQLLSARTGIVHAEGNDTDAPTRMLQLWFQPTTRGGPPAYYHRALPPERPGARHLLAGDATVPLRCDARVWWLDLAAGREEALEVPLGRQGYLLALDAPLTLASGEGLAVGDGAKVGPGAARVKGAGSALWIEVG